MIHKYIKIINYVIFKVHLIFQLFSKSIQKVNRGTIRVNLQNDTKLYCVSFKLAEKTFQNSVRSNNIFFVCIIEQCIHFFNKFL